MRILFISAIDFPEPLDRGARYHVHYWLKALSAEHHIDFLLVESHSPQRRETPILPTAKVINLGEPSPMDVGSRASRAVRALVSGTSRAALLARPKAARQFVQRAVKENRYDLAVLWAGSASGYAEILRGAVPIVLSKLSVDAIDARDQRKRKGMWQLRWAVEEWITQRFERRSCRAATAICTVNDEDAGEFVRRYQLGNIVRSIPIGVELQKFPTRLAAPQGKVVSFVGNLEWGANADAVNWLAQEIIPRILQVHPDANFRIIGPGGMTLREKYASVKIEFVGYVPDIAAALADVAVGVVPILSGTGMRLKLIELLSLGVPAVTTTLGAAGIPCTSGQQLLIADDTEQFAAAVNLLLSDGTLREKLGQAGSELAEEFSWANIENRVRLLVEDTVAAAAKMRLTTHH
jgi:glycosyltransferase involved in cell wall biosynthesis